MKRFILFILLFATSLGTFLSAQTIELKKTFWGYKYMSENQKLPSAQALKRIKTNPEAAPYISDAQVNKFAAFALGFAGGFILGGEAVRVARGENPKALQAIGALGLLAGGYVLDFNALKKTKKAIAIYNEGVETATGAVPSLQMGFGMGENGLGFLLRF